MKVHFEASKQKNKWVSLFFLLQSKYLKSSQIIFFHNFETWKMWKALKISLKIIFSVFSFALEHFFRLKMLSRGIFFFVEKAVKEAVEVAEWWFIFTRKSFHANVKWRFKETFMHEREAGMGEVTCWIYKQSSSDKIFRGIPIKIQIKKSLSHS